MADELSRWAAQRAPDLIARAEAEVVAELRRALLDAATGGGRRRDAPPAPAPEPRAPEPAPAPPRAPEPAPQGDVLWAYGIVRADASLPSIMSAVGREHPVEPIAHEDLVLLVGRVPRAEFGAEPLHRNLNDLAWLERVARAHEAVLDEVLGHVTVVPLRLSTIFETARSASAMLEARADDLRAALAGLEGREEWSVKLLVDPEALRAAASHGEAEAGDAGSGAAYMLRRRAEREQREAADRLAAGIADDVHARLQDWAIDAVLRPAQNRELSGHVGDMLLNGAYLVETAKVPRLREIVDELRERHAALGARIELTGPFPPYNFVPRLES